MNRNRNLFVVVAVVACLAVLIVWTFALAAGDKKVAVLELVNKAGITDDEAYFLTDKVRRTASQTLPISHFTIMTSENIQEMLPPGKDLAKCTDAACEVELGREIGAEYLITGEIIRYAGDLRVQIKVHHVPSGHFIGSEDTKAGSLEDQEGMLTASSSILMNKVLRHAGVQAPARAGGGAVFVQPTQPTGPSGQAEVRVLAPTELPPPTATGPAGLYITSKPAGAEVYLGQTKAGTTSPAFQKVNLQTGTNVRITLKMDLYHDAIFDAQLKPGITKFEGVELKPAFGSLKIESEPSGADVLIGGEKVGTTPFSDQRYPSGQYLVTVKKEWYLPQEDIQITVSDGQATTKMFALSQDFGTLEVASEPTGATVTLDGKKLGTTPGSWRVPPVMGGKLEVTLARHRGKSFQITIDRNQTVKITAEQATLTAKVGSLQVYADPPEPGAKVFVDGREVGTAPATVGDLIEGGHEVKVETKDKSGTSTVNIQEGQTAVATVPLGNRSGLAAGGAVWTDSSTGLTWQVSPTGGEMKWSAAKSHCEGLSLGGQSGWRLPTITELRSLIRGCPATQKGGSCGVTDSCLSYKSCRTSVCDGCSSKGGPGSGGAYWPPDLSGEVSWYWSSSAVADLDRYAWYVYFYDGDVYNGGYVNDGHDARCVR
ncbi:MAG: PEGA domain-containing protein [Candidatus Lernaella stagnicola]|nr:PEGA domain-containing protein [Candidatus Lernaella stagnicola]